MKSKSMSVEQLKEWGRGSELSALWLMVPMFLTLCPWARVLVTGEVGRSMDVMAYTNMAAIVLIAAVIIMQIVREKLPRTALWSVVNMAMMLWWINMVPVTQLGAGGEALGLLFGGADLFILTIVLASRVLRSVDVRRIYMSTILFVIQALYLACCMTGYASLLLVPFNEIAL